MGILEVVRVIIALAVTCLFLAGCKSDVTRSDTAAMRKEFSQENYEKAMHAAGKDAELQKEKEEAARRGEPQ